MALTGLLLMAFGVPAAVADRQRRPRCRQAALSSPTIRRSSIAPDPGRVVEPRSQRQRGGGELHVGHRHLLRRARHREETGDTVTVDLQGGMLPGAVNRTCIMIALFGTLEVPLQAPLGDRQVLSAS